MVIDGLRETKVVERTCGAATPRDRDWRMDSHELDHLRSYVIAPCFIVFYEVYIGLCCFTCCTMLTLNLLYLRFVSK